MDRITLSSQNRLFWLGRYAERVYRATDFMMELYDQMIDNKEIPYREYCQQLGIPSIYQDENDFFKHYLFDGGNPFSVRAAADAMLGNGMELRSTITSKSLSYLQMASSALEQAERSDSPCMELQTVIDDITAFRGSFDDTIQNERVRNTIKTGREVERLSLMLRMRIKLEYLDQELSMLLFRLEKTNLQFDQAAFDVILGRTNKELSASIPVLLNSVENLVQV
ncbi:MAG: alpha-E domain-containing protein [Lachnospiraceae bacterium]|nr:alpha-E domain-containing protein [Lachnospiraceae bacterium]